MSLDTVPTPEGPAGLLLTRDLIFTSKVTGTARELGHKVMVGGNVALVSAMIEKWSPVVVFVDLAAGELVSPNSIATFRKLAGETVPFVAFGSHVDTGALASAEAAGCVEVMPRSKFSGELPQLIEKYFGHKSA